MTAIVAHPAAHSRELRQLPLPVRVLRRDGALVRRGLSFDPIEVPPGTYVVIATLPAGATLASEVTVTAGDLHDVPLPLDPEDQTEYESHEVPRHIWGHGGEEVPADVAEELFARRAKLAVSSGNVLFGELRREPPNILERSNEPLPEGVLYFTPREHGVFLATLAQPGHSPVNAAFAAADYEAHCLVVVTLRPEGGFGLEVRLRNPAADALVAFMEHSRFGAAAEMTQAAALSAEALLFEKTRDPLAAAAGAYALLRLGELERLHDWTGNLYEWFPWLPDAVVIRAEHMARSGAGREAIEVLHGLWDRGLPIFTEGFSLAEDLLRRARDSRSRLLLDRLRDYTPFVDFNRTFVNYTGLEPGTPGLDSLDAHAYDDIKAPEIDFGKTPIPA
jgi:hypothetical protein